MPRQTLKQRPDGRFQCEYKGKVFYAKTQREALAKRAAYIKDLESGLRAEAAGLTVREYASQWVRVHKAEIGIKNYNAYVHHLNIMCEKIGNKRMQDVVMSDIQDIYNLRIGYSKSEISHFTQAVKGVFRAAKIDRLILFDPCDKAKIPKGTAGTHRAIEPWERDLVHRMAQTDHRFALAALVMLYAGLRRGEVLALDIDRDIDFKKKTIHVREAVRFESNQPIICGTKTESGMRDVPLVSLLANALSGRHGLVACAEDGTHMTESIFTTAWSSYINKAEAMQNGVSQKRWYGKTKAQRAILDAGGKLPPWTDFKVSPHDFRHSYCTMLFECGVDIKSAQKWMGHADDEMTRKIYTHLTAKQEQESIKKLHKSFDCQNDCQPLSKEV